MVRLHSRVVTNSSDAAWRVPWDSYRRSWMRHCGSKRLSEKTKKIYADFADIFVAWLATLPVEPIDPGDLARPATARDLRPAHVEEFLSQRGERGDAASYVHQHYRNLRTWMNFLVHDEEVDVSPVRRISEPIVPERSTPIISDEQVAALLRACAGKSFNQVRDTAIIRLLFATGGRRTEITLLTVDAVDMESDEIRVLGKGRRDRRIPFGARTGQALEKYLRIRARQRYAHVPELWLAGRDKGVLTPSGMAQMLERRAQQAGIPHIHPHLFRHKLADEWRRRDGDPQDLKRLMGWKSDAMLERYAASTADHRARQAHRRMRLDDRL